MSIEQMINRKLQDYPQVKKLIKHSYQRMARLVSRPSNISGLVTRYTPLDGYEYFYGYYDKSPWDATDRYVLVMRVRNSRKSAASSEPIEICLIDTAQDNKLIPVAVSRCWNTQQGCMAQWLGPDYKNRIIYNDFRDGVYCSVISNVADGTEEQVIACPVYELTHDGRVAFSLDFSRLNTLRPGYGYSNTPDESREILVPDAACIWKTDLETGVKEVFLKYCQLVNFQHRTVMDGAQHKVNHIMVSPGDERVMFMHRWYQGQKKYSRLLTIAIDGTGLYSLSDDDFVSHCFWKNDSQLIGFMNKHGEGRGYYLLEDMSQSHRRLWPEIDFDGHPSFSPDRTRIVTDRYPDKRRMQTISVGSEKELKVVASVFSPFAYDEDVRCDLHPRWNRAGDKICFDSACEGTRGLYVANIDADDSSTETVRSERRVKVLFVVSHLAGSGPTTQLHALVKYVDHSKIEPVICTMFPERNNSKLSEFQSLGLEVECLNLSRKSFFLTGPRALGRVLDSVRPDVVHSSAILADILCAHSRDIKSPYVMTIHNFAKEDLSQKHGKLVGGILAALEVNAIRRCNRPVSCSNALKELYREDGLATEAIPNGIDVTTVDGITEGERRRARENFGIPYNGVVFVSVGSLISRKDPLTVIRGFQEAAVANSYLIVAGGGSLLDECKVYGGEDIFVLGQVSNVREVLAAGDCFISSSNSEGLPYSVLEAGCAGLDLLLSDIPQHTETLPPDLASKCVFEVGSYRACAAAIKSYNRSTERRSAISQFIHANFSAETMAQEYQSLYLSVVRNATR